MATCTLTDCPGNLLQQEHELGDNECGYLNANEGPKPKNESMPTVCRRPSCARVHMNPEARLRHEADATRHRKKDMDFICDWTGHAEAIQEAGFCPVCQ